MADDTSVNAQITDAISQADVMVIGEAPAAALAAATQALAHATGLAMENAVQAQAGMQQINNVSVAAVTAMIMQAGPLQAGPLPATDAVGRPRPRRRRAKSPPAQA